MSRIARNLKIAALSIVMVVSVFLGVFFALDRQVAKADVMTNEGEFTIAQGAQARISTNCGIRFTLYFDDTFYNNIVENGAIKSGYELGMIIAPSVYFEDYYDYVAGTDYDQGIYNYFHDVKGKMIDLSIGYAYIYEDDTLGYCANGAIVNMKEANLDLDFSAVGYLRHTSGGVKTYRYTDVSLPRSIRYIATRCVEKGLVVGEQAQTLDTLYDIAGKGSYKVNTYIQNTTLDGYTLNTKKTLYLYDTVGSTVDYSSSYPEICGYYLNTGLSTLSGTVDEDGSLELDLYYSMEDGFAFAPAEYNPYDTVSTDTGVVYNGEASSTKMTFKNHKYANFNITSLSGISNAKGGYITFWIKNETGVALDYYSLYHLTVNGGVSSIASSSEWQKAKLYVDNTDSDTITVFLRTYNEQTTLSGGQAFYISTISMDEEATVSTTDGFSIVAETADPWSLPESVSSSSEKVYGTENYSTKVGIKAGYNKSIIRVNYPAGISCDYNQLDFYFYNDTGVDLKIYNLSGAETWAGVQRISSEKRWVKISSYVSYAPAGGYISLYIGSNNDGVISSSDVKYYYISAPSIPRDSGTYGTVNAYTVSSATWNTTGNYTYWQWQCCTPSVSATEQFEGKDTLRLDFSGNTNGGGMWVNNTILQNNINKIGDGSSNVSSITVSFYYKAENITAGFEYIGLSVGNAWDAVLDRTSGWHKFSYTFISMPSNFILHVSKMNGGSYTSTSDLSGVLYVSQLEYTVNNNEGALTSFDAGTDAVGGDYAYSVGSSSEKTFNGKNTLRVDMDGSGAYWSGVNFGSAHAKEILTTLVGLIGTNGVQSITLSFYYNASQVAGAAANYIGLLEQPGGVALDKSEGWHKFSYTLTAVPTLFIISVAWNSTGSWTSSPLGVYGTLYLSDIEYKVNHSGDTVDYSVDAIRNENGNLTSFATATNISEKVSAWTGSFEAYTDAEQGRVIRLSDSANGRLGVDLTSAKNQINSLLATAGVSGVKVYFKYKAVDMNWNALYAGVHNDGTTDYIVPIAIGAWTDFEATITGTMSNFVLGCFTTEHAGWIGGYGLNGTAYFTDILYEVIYDNGITAGYDDISGCDYAEISAKSKRTEITVNFPSANSTGGISFDILNRTGRKLYVYTDASAWSGKVLVASSSSWQTVKLYVPSSSTSVKVYIETVDGKSFNPTLSTTLYFRDFGSASAPVARGINIASGGATDFQIVYANDASAAEINAATRLKTYLDESTGLSFGLTNYAARNKSLRYIGVGDGFSATTSIDSSEPNAYAIKKQDSNLYIYGVADSGTSFGVMDFLAEYFGYVYTDSAHTINSVSSLSLSAISETTLIPTVSMRAYIGYATMTSVFNGVWSNQSAFNQELSFNTKQNTNWVDGVYETDLNWANYSGALNKFAYIGATTHNSQFTLNEGVRLYNLAHGTSLSAASFYSVNNGAVDICYSANVGGITSVELVALAIEKLIDANYASGVRYYVFQQTDYVNAICQCEACSGRAGTLKGKSGLQNWFVNQVVAKIDADGYADYDYKIVIYAYYETKNAPTAVASTTGVYDTSKTFSNVLSNKVVVQFAFIGQDYHYGVYDTHVESKDILDKWTNFMSAGYETWFWLYDTDFGYYAGYFPALNCIADNVYAAKRFNASAVFINSSYDAPHDWDSKLRRYVYSKMLWDFDETEYLKGDANGDGVNDYVKAVAMEYLNSYYGTENGALVWSIIQCYESSSAGKTVKSNGKSTYSLGGSFYNDRFSNIFYGNGSTTGVYYTTDATIKTRLKEVMLSVAADLYYIGGVIIYNESRVSSFFGTTNVRSIFKALADEVGFTQWGENYSGENTTSVAYMWEHGLI